MLSIFKKKNKNSDYKALEDDVDIEFKTQPYKTLLRKYYFDESKYELFDKKKLSDISYQTWGNTIFASLPPESTVITKDHYPFLKYFAEYLPWIGINNTFTFEDEEGTTILFNNTDFDNLCYIFDKQKHWDSLVYRFVGFFLHDHRIFSKYDDEYVFEDYAHFVKTIPFEKYYQFKQKVRWENYFWLRFSYYKQTFDMNEITEEIMFSLKPYFGTSFPYYLSHYYAQSIQDVDEQVAFVKKHIDDLCKVDMFGYVSSDNGKYSKEFCDKYIGVRCLHHCDRCYETNRFLKLYKILWVKIRNK